jgi:hypothetical protein
MLCSRMTPPEIDMRQKLFRRVHRTLSLRRLHPRGGFLDAYVDSFIRVRIVTISHERDSSIALARDVEPHRSADNDLHLLDDVRIGHAGVREKMAIATQAAR